MSWKPIFSDPKTLLLTNISFVLMALGFEARWLSVSAVPEPKWMLKT